MRKLATLVLVAFVTLARAQEVAPLSDQDGDGLPAAVEWACATDPGRADTDLDGVPDGWEALAPGGNPLDPLERREGPGLRVWFWREGPEAWVLVCCRGTEEPLRVRVLLPGGSVDLTPLLVDLGRSPGGVRAWSLGFPAGVLPAVGGRLLVSGQAGGLTGQAQALLRGQGWHTLQWTEGRARSLWAERRVVNPFPEPASLQTPVKVCVQKLQRMREVRGEPLYSEYMVVREDCLEPGPTCVDDCGGMLGASFVWLTSPR